jgi:peptidyl-prolyl cis-trans isomerase C
MKLRHLLTPLLSFAFLTACDQAASPDPDSTPAPAQESAPAGDADAAPVVVEEDVTVTLTEEEAPAAAETEADLPDPVAMINGQPLSKAEFEATLNEIFSSMGMQVGMLPPDQRGMLFRQFVEDMITDKLIDQASEAMAVTPEEVDAELGTISQQYGSQERFAEELSASGQTIDEFKERLSKLLRQRKWMESQATGDGEVTDAQVRAFYDENIQEFEQPDVVRASHILIRVEEDADEATVEAKREQAADLASKAKAGGDFGQLAEEFSEDPTAKQNAGDLNFFPKDRMVPEFAEAAFAQEIDSISEPVRTQFGWHVIKVTEKKAAQTLPFDEVKGDIAEYLKENEQQQAVEGVIAKLRETANVEIFIPEPQMPQMDLQIQGLDAIVPAEE